MRDEIKIGNLSVFQKHLLDKIWGFQTEDDLRSWLETLPNNVLQQAVSLIQVLQLEVLDQRWDNEEEGNFAEANEVLKQFML